MIETVAHTSSLARWFGTPAEQPEPCEIEGPAVMATPHTVSAWGLNPAALVLDMEEGELRFLGTTVDLVSEERFTISELACLVGQLPQLVMACSDDEPGEELAFRTQEGITVSRLEPGVIELGTVTDSEVVIHLPTVTAWQLVAEITALMIRQMAHTADIAEQLEAALEQSN